MAQDKITTPSSMAGILGFYDVNTGGPKLDPRGVLAAAILFIVFVKIVSWVMQ